MNDNKLIAEFMGLSIKEGVCYYTDADDMFPMGIEVEEPYLPYHTLWDWLMPVVIKCKESVDYCSDDNALDYHNIEDEMLSQLSIEDTHKAVVKFIKTYNNG